MFERVAIGGPPVDLDERVTVSSGRSLADRGPFCGPRMRYPIVTRSADIKVGPGA
jgi:hypothetical protein